MTDASTTWSRLRLKIGTGDDADWRGTQVTPNTLTALVGGTTTAGVYSITLTGKVHTRFGTALDINVTATITRAAETDAQIAADLEADLDAATISPTSSVTLASQGITASVSSETVTITFPPNAEIVATSSAPAPGTITWALGTIVPISASAPHYARSGNGLNGVVVAVSAMDDAGETLLDPEDGGTDQSFVIEAMEIAFVQRIDSNGVIQYHQRIHSIETITGALLNTEYILQLRGAKYWTVRLHTFAENIANVDSYEVSWRDAAI